MFALPVFAQGGGDGRVHAGPSLGDPEALTSEFAGHVLRRMTFGPSPDSLAELLQVGGPAFLDAQLNPLTIPETAEYLALEAQIPVPSSPYDGVRRKELVRYEILRAVYSRRQLQEQMVRFWENHFNTDHQASVRFLGGSAQPGATYLEWVENESFRANACGRFADLLRVSATSPAMLIYLDGESNSKAEPNENYARELLERHTVGPDVLYTQQDVQEIARCFTGWSVCQVDPSLYGDPHAVCNTGANRVWNFRFKSGRHDEGAKVIFAGTPHELYVPPRSGDAGIQDGYDVLDHLASLPQTAEYVGGKLIQRFVRDDVKPPLVRRLRNRWLATGGDVREVLRTLFMSSTFRRGHLRWNKVRTPLESMVSAVRALDGKIDGPSRLDALRFPLDGVLNQPLFHWSTPDGYPEEASVQMAPGKLFGALIFRKFIHDSPGVGIVFDVPGLLADHGVALDDADAIVDFFVELLFAGNFDAADRAAALEFLTTDDAGAPRPLDPSSEDEYADRVHLFAVYLLSTPQALQQ